MQWDFRVEKVERVEVWEEVRRRWEGEKVFRKVERGEEGGGEEGRGEYGRTISWRGRGVKKVSFEKERAVTGIVCPDPKQ